MHDGAQRVAHLVGRHIDEVLLPPLGFDGLVPALLLPLELPLLERDVAQTAREGVDDGVRATDRHQRRLHPARRLYAVAGPVVGVPFRLETNVDHLRLSAVDHLLEAVRQHWDVLLKQACLPRLDHGGGEIDFLETAHLVEDVVRLEQPPVEIHVVHADGGGLGHALQILGLLSPADGLLCGSLVQGHIRETGQDLDGAPVCPSLGLGSCQHVPFRHVIDGHEIQPGSLEAGRVAAEWRGCEVDAYLLLHAEVKCHMIDRAQFLVRADDVVVVLFFHAGQEVLEPDRRPVLPRKARDSIPRVVRRCDVAQVVAETHAHRDEFRYCLELLRRLGRLFGPRV